MGKGGQKRPATDAIDDRPSKVARKESEHALFETEIDAARIPKGFSPKGYITGKIISMSPVDKDKHLRFLFDSKGRRLRVDITLSSASQLDMLLPGQLLAISLQGARNKPITDSKGDKATKDSKGEGEETVLFRLVFSKGVVLKLLKKDGKEDAVIDTNAPPPPADDDWFATPREILKDEGSPPDSLEAADEDDQPSPDTTLEPTTANPQKQKRIKKRDTRHANNPANNPAAQSSTAQIDITKESKQAKYRSKLEKLEKRTDSQSAAGPSGAQSGKAKKKKTSEASGPADLQAGLKTSVGIDFKSLEALQAPEQTGKRGLHAAGIVVRSNVKDGPNRKGDWQASYWITDPSTVTDNLNVNLFDARSAALPNAQIGEVLLLKHLNGGSFNGKTALVGYSDKFRWAVYNRDSGTQRTSSVRELEMDPEELAYCVDLSEWYKAVTEKDGPASFVQAKKSREVVKLQDIKEDVFCDLVVQVVRVWPQDHTSDFYVTDFTENPLFGDPRQSTWTLSDSSSTPMPNSYVYKLGLWGKPNQMRGDLEPNQYYRLKNVRPKMGRGGYLEGSLGANELDDERNLVRIGNNDSRAVELRKRKIEFIKRTRPGLASRISSDAGSSATADTREEVEEDVLDDDSHATSESPELTVSELHKGKICTIVGEVLKNFDAMNVTDVMVTDYTENPRLTSYPDVSGWSPPPGKRSLQIGIFDDYRKVATSLSVGVYAKFEYVLIRTVTKSGSIGGKIGDAVKRPCRITVLSPNDPALIELKRRKNEVYRREGNKGLEKVPSKQLTPLPSHRSPSASETEDEEQEEEHGTSTPPTSPGDGLSSSYQALEPSSVSPPPEREGDSPEDTSAFYSDIPLTSIPNLRANNNCPGIFRVRARVSAFFPHRLREFVRETCSKCDRMLAISERVCAECMDEDDDDSPPVPRWQFAFVLEDKAGERLPGVTCAGDDATRFLGDMKPTNLVSNREALGSLRDRLRPLLGNLEEVQLRLLKDTDSWRKAQTGKGKAKQTVEEPLEPIAGQWAYWTIKCWQIDEGTRWAVIHNEVCVV